MIFSKISSSLTAVIALSATFPTALKDISALGLTARVMWLIIGDSIYEPISDVRVLNSIQKMTATSLSLYFDT